MKPVTKAYIDYHIAVLLYGLTAILGDLIELSSMVIVWYRVLFASASLLLLVRVGQLLRTVPAKRIGQYLGVGVIVALHWTTFFAAIKYANASTALICMACTSLFTAFIEPIMFGRRPRRQEILLALAVVPGMALVVHGGGRGMAFGILLGLISALLAAFWSTCNKKLIHYAEPRSITLLEFSSAFAFLSLLIPYHVYISGIDAIIPSASDIVYLLILSFVCTTLAYLLSVRALRHLSAFAATLTINLEPIYGIVLAWFVLQEGRELTWQFYLGGAIVLLSVFSYPLMQKQPRLPSA